MAALVLVGAVPEEVAIHSGAPTAGGDTSHVEDPFDPCSINDPRFRMCETLADIQTLCSICSYQCELTTCHQCTVAQAVAKQEQPSFRW